MTTYHDTSPNYDYDGYSDVEPTREPQVGDPCSCCGKPLTAPLPADSPFDFCNLLGLCKPCRLSATLDKDTEGESLGETFGWK